MTRIALVTGASSGLGREFVKRIDAGEAGQFDEVWAVARRADRLDALVRTCATKVRPFCLDLTDVMSFDMIEGALAETEGADVGLLVNNAGFGVFGDFALSTRDEPTDMLNILVKAPVELMYRALPHMHAGARIINVASVAAFLPQPRLAVYAAAKRFILDITRALDAELGDVNIHATALCPKFMKTEFLDAPGDAEVARKMSEAIGFERADEVVTAALRASRAGRSLCIPSLDMKAYYLASRVMPYPVALKLEKMLGAL